MPGFVTTRLLGYLSGGLGLALVAASIFGWVQTDRLNATQGTVKALKDQIVLWTARVKGDEQMIASRDQLISTQNKAVQALKDAADADRTAYLARIKQADQVAVKYQHKAADIMALKLDSDDELTRSRAALALIQETLNADPD